MENNLLENNLFSALEGLRGEPLAVKALHFLFTRSDAARRALNKHFVVLNCDAESEFRCEESTENRKRIDLVVESSTCVLGIEAKLWARLDNDLDSYLKDIKKKAGEKKEAVLTLLVPQMLSSRLSDEVRTKNLSNETKLVVWEKILEAILSDSSNTETDRSLCNFLKAFIEGKGLQQLGKFDKHDYLCAWEGGETVCRRLFLENAKNAFDFAGPIRKGSDFYGFNFEMDQLDNQNSPFPMSGWIGFIPFGAGDKRNAHSSGKKSRIRLVLEVNVRNLPEELKQYQNDEDPVGWSNRPRIDIHPPNDNWNSTEDEWVERIGNLRDEFNRQFERELDGQGG